MGEMTNVGNLIAEPSKLRHQIKNIYSNLKDKEFDFIASNAPEGMIPGWELRNYLTKSTDKNLPYVYIREKKKKGGHKGDITGSETSSLINKGDEAIIVESVGDDQTFLNKIERSVSVMKETGYEVNNVITPIKRSKKVKDKLEEKNLNLIETSENKNVANFKPKRPQFKEKSSKDISKLLIESGAMEIRDLESGKEPFLYSSGLWGPGYLMVKGLVGQPEVMRELCWNLAVKLRDKDFDFVIGNVTGGVIPGWQIRNFLEILREEEVPFIYAEGTRLLENGLVEGDFIGDHNSSINKGDRALIVEELVNTAGTTTGSAMHARKRGFEVEHAATIFHYKNPIALERLEDNNLNLTYLTTLPKTLEIAEKERLFKPRAVEDYRFFMEKPKKYQEKWGLEPVKEGGTE